MKINELTLNHKPMVLLADDQRLVERIRRDCSQFIPIMKRYGYLYHGFREIAEYGIENPHQFMAASRKVRRSTHTPSHIQKKIDSYLSQMGFEALRGNSLFCTSNKGIAAYYGSLFYIFPINGFKYTYCPTDDLYNSSMGRLKTQLADPLYTPENFVEEYGFKKTDLGKAIDYGYEIYIHGQFIALGRKKYRDLVEKTWPSNDVENFSYDYTPLE